MQGQIIVYTGNGRGKTSAANGAVIRALSLDKKVRIVQFLKGDIPSGEVKFYNNLEKDINIYRAGRNFFISENQREEQRELALKGLQRAFNYLSQNPFLLVLDEINTTLFHKLIRWEELKLLLDKRNKTHIIATGRGANLELIEYSDTVSEIKEIKHAYQKSKSAIKGIDY